MSPKRGHRKRKNRPRSRSRKSVLFRCSLCGWEVRLEAEKTHTMPFWHLDGEDHCPATFKPDLMERVEESR